MFFQPYNISDEYSDKELRKHEKRVGSEVIDHLRRAKICYTVNCHPDAAEFQGDVWESLGELAGGLMEDPQTGVYVLAKGTDKKTLFTPKDDENDMFVNFFKQAEQNGFPIEKTLTDKVLRIEKLSKDELERLLRLEKKMFFGRNLCIRKQFVDF